MKNKKINLSMIFFLSSFICSAQSFSDPTIAVHYMVKKADIAVFPSDSRELFPGVERFTPSRQEIEIAEHALETQLTILNSDRQNQYDTPVIDKNLSKYKRQYFGYIDKNGNKILLINCFWKRDKDSDLLWLNERIMVLDGGSYFWNVKFNLFTNELFDLDVNAWVK